MSYLYRSAFTSSNGYNFVLTIDCHKVIKRNEHSKVCMSKLISQLLYCAYVYLSYFSNKVTISTVSGFICDDLGLAACLYATLTPTPTNSCFVYNCHTFCYCLS